MWDCFDTHGIPLKVVDEEITTRRKYGVPEHKEPYAKTKIQWKHQRNKRVCYQLETSHTDRHADKLFQGDPKMFLKQLDFMGIESVPLGLPLTVSESIKVASECDMFIGICSGMAHVCYSVGIPVFIQDWKQLKKFHPNKSYTTYEGEDDLIRKVMEHYDTSI
jgi:hypothetical protein